MTIKRNISKVCIHSDFQMIVNGKIAASKDIINLEENIRCLLPYIKETKLKYYNRNINKEANVLSKMVYL